MMNYEEYHARCAHAQTCDHDMVWMVEPIVTQLNDPETPVLLHDQTYLAGLINHLAERIDEKDGQLSSGTAIMTQGQALLDDMAERLQEATKRLLIVSGLWLLSLGVAVGLFVAR